MEIIKPTGEELVPAAERGVQTVENQTGLDGLPEFERNSEGVKLIKKVAECVLSVHYDDNASDYRYGSEQQAELRNLQDEDEFHHFFNGINGAPFFAEGKSFAYEIGNAGPGGTTVEFQRTEWKKTEEGPAGQYVAMIIKPKDSRWGPYAFVSSLDGQEKIVLRKNDYRWRYLA